MLDLPIYSVVFKLKDDRFHLSHTCFQSWHEADIFAKDKFMNNPIILGYSIIFLSYKEVYR